METVLLEGLEDGRWALATKTRHCLVDGIASVDVGYVLLDDEPIPKAGNRRPGRQPQAQDRWRMASLLFRGARGGLSAATHPRTVLKRARATLDMLIKEELIAAPTTSLNEPIGGMRRYALVRMPHLPRSRPPPAGRANLPTHPLPDQLD